MNSSGKTGIDELLSEYVGPVLREAGFRRSGRRFTMESEDRSTCVVLFRRHDLAPTVRDFFCDWSITPHALREYMEAETGRTKSVDSMWGVLRCSLMPFGEWGVPMLNGWTFSTDDGALGRCGAELSARLVDTWIPYWKNLLTNGSALMDAIRAPLVFNDAGFIGYPEWAELFLKVDSGTFDEVTQLMRYVAADNYSPSMVAWLRDRISTRWPEPDR